MATTRRRFVQGSVAAATLMAAPAIGRASETPAAAKTLKAVMQGDLRSLDPIWTTANISLSRRPNLRHAVRRRRQRQAAAADGRELRPSDDQLAWTFKLRDGLTSRSSPVTAADCVASIRRWAVRDGAGQHMFLRVKDISAKDDKTFTVALSEPYLSCYHPRLPRQKPGTPVLYIMP